MAATPPPIHSVQCFGRKKTAVAVTYCKTGRGLIKINGTPIELVQPEILRYKVFEPILLLGRSKFNGVDMRIRVKGGGHTSQIYAIRQSIAKALVAYYQKFVDVVLVLGSRILTVFICNGTVSTSMYVSSFGLYLISNLMSECLCLVNLIKVRINR